MKIYRAPLSFVNVGRFQSGPGFNDLGKSRIASIWQRYDHSKMRVRGILIRASLPTPESAPTKAPRTLRKDQKNNRKRWELTPARLLGISVAVAVIGALVIPKILLAITYQKNQRIKNIDCHFNETVDGVKRDFSYFQKQAEDGSAGDQYCLAQMYETGNGIAPSLSKARELYKQAFDQGLRLSSAVELALCNPELFQEANGDFAEFIPICCPRPPAGTVCMPPACPWENDRLNGSGRGGC